MSETAEVILGICVLPAVITLTRKYHTWRVKRGCILIGEALKAQGAFDAKSAIDLPYALSLLPSVFLPQRQRMLSAAMYVEHERNQHSLQQVNGDY